MDVNDSTPINNNLGLSKTKNVIALGFATQGLGYATVMTALPTFKSHFKLSEDQLSIIILGVCISAALGSILADRLAVKLSSRFAIVTGFICEAIGIAIAAMSSNLTMMVISFLIYGIGLGCLDAALNMQAVMMEQKIGKSALGGFFACYTAAAFLGALIMSATIETTFGANIALFIAVIIALITAQCSKLWLFQQKENVAIHQQGKSPIPHKQLWIFGFIIFIAFTVDSAISTWSSIYLIDVLTSSATIAPLGYAAYQVGILITRLSLDYILKFKTASWLVVLTILIGAIGCAVVGLGQSITIVMIGFALAVGALVPLTFSAVGKLDQSRRDEIIARVNIFNYGGAIAGAVVMGLLASPIGFGASFIALGLCLILVLLFKEHF